jgi:hypothetical protein
MHADIARDSFTPEPYRRLVWLQGRVLLESDLNLQTTTLLRSMQQMMRDIVGPFGGPDDACGFRIDQVGGVQELAKNKDPEGLRLSNFILQPPNPKVPKKTEWRVWPGRYYVQGLEVSTDSPRVLPTEVERWDEQIRDGGVIVYLDAWEHYVSPQAEPRLLDAALRGIDTTGRTRIVWRVRVAAVDWATRDEVYTNWDAWVAKNLATSAPAPRLMAASKPDDADAEAGLGPTEPSYTGENRLYRVEVHQVSGGPETNGLPAKLKWSRDNGSVLYRIMDVDERRITLESLGADTQLALQRGDWVELIKDGRAAPPDAAGPLYQVEAEPDADSNSITLKDSTLSPNDFIREVSLLRRWDDGASNDRHDGLIPMTDPESSFKLEHGLELKFDKTGTFRAGDYWLIPARTGIGLDSNAVGADGVPAAGGRHYYAPLALIEKTNKTLIDLRKRIKPLAT